MKTFDYQLVTKSGTPYEATAADEKKARTSMQRKRLRHRDSYNCIARASILCIGESAASKAGGSSLVEALKKETAKLKNLYLIRSIEYADNVYKSRLEIVAQGLPEAPAKDYRGFFLDKEAGKIYRAKVANYYEAKSKTTITIAAHAAIAKEQAEAHYERSILKLALCVLDKGLDESKISASSSHVGHNFDTTLTDGDKTVRAFTILAWGPIVRPHFRYLIK
jgi:hypothetical protein